MAHELELNQEGQIEMAYAGEVPWHSLGNQVESDLSPVEFMKAANLDWEVEKRPLFIDTPVGREAVEGKSMLVRTDSGKHLDIVGNDWNPVQNSQAFDFFESVVESGDMWMHTAGALQGGRRVWAMATIKDEFELFGGDVVKGNLLFSSPHLYGETITCMFTPIRVVCNNTLSMALSSNATRQNQVRWSHRLAFDPELVKEMLGISSMRLSEYKEAAEFLGSRQFTKESVVNYFSTVFPTRRTVVNKDTGESDGEFVGGRNAKRAYELLETQPGAEFSEGSWWQAFNASTYMVDHVMGKTDDSRMNNSLFGYGAKYKANAYKKALEFAEAS